MSKSTVHLTNRLFKTSTANSDWHENYMMKVRMLADERRELIQVKTENESLKVTIRNQHEQLAEFESQIETLKSEAQSNKIAFEKAKFCIQHVNNEMVEIEKIMQTIRRENAELQVQVKRLSERETSKKSINQKSKKKSAKK